jgi:FtsK/SpoIIIE family
MTGRQRIEPEALALMIDAVGGIWRWRLELSLAALPALAHVLIVGLLGDLVGWLLSAAAIGLAIGVPGCRRRLTRGLAAARVRRRWRRAWTDCDLLPVRARQVTPIPAGDLVRVRAARGSSLDDVASRAEQLAVCLKARELRVARDPDNAATGTVTLVHRDPLADTAGLTWPHVHAGPLSLWEPIPIGVDELGGTVSVRLPERNMLLGGEPGAGKSAALSLLVATAALDPSCRLWLLDGKLVELSAWAPCGQRLAGPDLPEAIELLRTLRVEMDERYRELLARGARKITVGDGLPLHLVACDELAFYLTAEDRKQRAQFAELLRDLVARGRAAGVIVVCATQKPGADVVPTALRDLFGFRLALRCNTPQASDTILGQGWATASADASTIPGGQRGVGYLLAEGERPERIKTFHLADDEIAAIAERATARRADVWLAAATPAGQEQPA